MSGQPARTHAYAARCLVIRGRSFVWGERTFVMGIINVTPDSFSGDGLGGDVAASVAQALAFEAAGADILDLGAESSRPGAEELEEGTEALRLMPHLRAIRAATALPISVDTYHAAVAEQALAAGADMLNDIHGFQRDPRMAKVAATADVPIIAMHNQRGRHVTDVGVELMAGIERIEAIAASAGIARGQLIVDPGFGFGWTPAENLELIRQIPKLSSAGLPILVGVSRKSTIGHVLGSGTGERLDGAAALVTLAIAGGADIVRVHDVAAMVRVCRMADAVIRGWEG